MANVMLAARRDYLGDEYSRPLPPVDPQEAAARMAAYQLWLGAYNALSEAQKDAWQALTAQAKDWTKQLSPAELTAFMSAKKPQTTNPENPTMNTIPAITRLQEELAIANAALN